jgi:hypothetical protein
MATSGMFVRARSCCHAVPARRAPIPAVIASPPAMAKLSVTAVSARQSRRISDRTHIVVAPIVGRIIRSLSLGSQFESWTTA